MSYIGTEPKDIRSFGRTKFDYTATQGQTAFTGADDDGKVLAFTTGQIEVYVNGILMDDSDFSTTGTGTVTLASAANLNDVVNVVSFETNIPDSNYVPASGGTFTGAVTHSGNVTHSGTVTNSSTTTMTGDLTVDTNTFHVDVADNRVGVGTTTPVHDLQIHKATASSQARIQMTTNESGATNGDGYAVAMEAGNRVYHWLYENAPMQFATNNTLNMVINANGSVTMPNQPAFNIVGTQNGYSARITAGGTTNAIPFNLARGQGTSGFNTSNGVYTAPVTGTYLFTLQTIIATGANHEIYMYKNGTLYARHYPEGGRGASFSSIVPMAVNDYIVFGCDFDVYLQNTTSNYSSASIALIG